jgi:hypothetical protein
VTPRYCVKHPTEKLLVLSGACGECDLEEFRRGLAEAWLKRHPAAHADVVSQRCPEHDVPLLPSCGRCPICAPAAVEWDRGFWGNCP